MTAKHYLIIVIVGALAFGAGFWLKQPAEDVVELNNTLQQANQAFATAEHAINLWQQTSAELKLISSQNKAIKAALDESKDIISLLEESVLDLAKMALESKNEIDSLTALLKTEPPTDYEDCVEQLDIAHLVIDSQGTKIQTLQAVNAQQGLIIEQKDVQIDLKDTQVELYKAAMDAWRRRALLSVTGNVALVILILLL